MTRSRRARSRRARSRLSRWVWRERRKRWERWIGREWGRRILDNAEAVALAVIVVVVVVVVVVIVIVVIVAVAAITTMMVPTHVGLLPNLIDRAVSLGNRGTICETARAGAATAALGGPCCCPRQLWRFGRGVHLGTPISSAIALFTTGARPGGTYIVVPALTS